MIPIDYFLYLSSFLFCIGFAIVLSQKHIIAILMGIELIFNAANINLVAFSRYDLQLHGQIFSLFVMIIAAAETAVALTIAYLIYKQRKIDKPNLLKELKD
jgi:NADH:ubiquinone oxidoreductase subunit K